MSVTTRSTILETVFGLFQLSYHAIGPESCVSLVLRGMDDQTPLVRLHSACLFGEAFHSNECDCKQQLVGAMQRIQNHGHGVIVYSCTQEGRGIGLENKIRAMEIQRTTGCDTVEAFRRLGFSDPDQRDYRAELKVLKELGVPKRVHLLTGNLKKRKALLDNGYELV